ncbi:LytS family sensor histidine kinase [Litoribacter populi]|uniref:GHKL domain-containing protein n=1 Tax=Litoribacter populi TaxID=2598460 RepID=UPI00117F801E|nr:GHKL domain-containing protein [Litoribacter populi]
MNFAIEGNLENHKISPLIFIHLLENAFKHSPSWLHSKDIKVKLFIEGNKLAFRIENPIDENGENSRKQKGGTGLSNVRKRLRLLYPGKHTFETYADSGKYTVILNLYDLYAGEHERNTHMFYN